MGLDQTMYVAAKLGQYDEFNKAQYGIDTSTRNSVTAPREIARWRKHPNLQGWMEQLWYRKGAHLRNEEYEKLYKSSFNGVELELSWDDLDEFEQAIKDKKLPPTQGFFFGNCADERYYNYDLESIRVARAELFLGLKVFYNSSW
jgi:hypothetical protein